MKPFVLLAFFAFSGCGDLFDGIRIGTDETAGGTSAAIPLYRATYRAADFVRFPGDRDSVVANTVVEAERDLVVPASSSSLLLCLWNGDSAVGAWVRDPTPRFPPTRTSTVVAIDLTDSVTNRMFELSVVGTGIASTGSRVDSTRTRHRVRSPGGMATLAIRWNTASSWNVIFIDSVSMDRDRSIEMSGSLEAPSGTRVRLDSTGAIARSIDGI